MGWILGIGVAVAAAAWAAWHAVRRRRLERLAARPLPAEWDRVLREQVPLYRRVPEALRPRLHGLLQVLIAQKNFEGCGGCAVTDETRVIIAAQACLLWLGREGVAPFPGLRSILLYPGSFFVPDVDHLGSVALETEEERDGESWGRGAVVLAWDDVKASTLEPTDGHNVVIHEFAHQLDTQNGVPDGLPELAKGQSLVEWGQVLSREYRQLRRRVDRGDVTLLDGYGAEAPAEFFAVASETFFEESALLRNQHPALYKALSEYYRLDPASWVASAAAGG
jgi:Mlc titration factor MtfA (ptsG expression regulator)